MFSAKLWMVLSFIDALSQEKGGNRLPANPGPSEVTEFSVLVQGKESGPSVVHSWVRDVVSTMLVGQGNGSCHH